jgi:Cu+-exporting ATPase
VRWKPPRAMAVAEVVAAAVTSVSGKPGGLSDTLDLGRATRRSIRQDLDFAFGYQVVAIPLSAVVVYPFFGIRPSPLVVNANRLRRWQRAPQPSRCDEV